MLGSKLIYFAGLIIFSYFFRTPARYHTLLPAAEIILYTFTYLHGHKGVGVVVAISTGNSHNSQFPVPLCLVIYQWMVHMAYVSFVVYLSWLVWSCPYPLGAWFTKTNPCSWCCSSYIFILDWTPGFNGLGKDHYKTGQEAFTFWDLVCLILEVWQ